MPYAFKLFHRLSRTRWALLCLSVAAVFACDHPITDPAQSSIDFRRASRIKPGQVTDLAVTATSDSGVTLTFTEVTDGVGQPATYDVREATDTFSWAAATSVTLGTCATPMAGAAIGATRDCSVLGLTPGTTYTFQLVAFRGTISQNPVYGARSNQVSGTTTDTVAPGVPVATVTVSPASAAILVGGKVQLAAAARDSAANVLTGRVVTWASSAPAVATMSASGLVTGAAAGTATLTATSEGQSGTAAVTVAIAPVASVTVSPASAGEQVGQTVQLTATPKDAAGNPLAGRTVTWRRVTPRWTPCRQPGW